LAHNLFLIYLSISTCFGRPCVHHQEKQLYLCDTWYLLFSVDDCLPCTLHTRQLFLLMMGTYSRLKHLEIDKYTKNKLCTKLALFTRLYKNARSTKHKR